MTKLYANISIGHENDPNVLERRIIAAAQCNADAVVLSKCTPSLVVPKDKKYISISSKWGTLPYIEVANRSELSPPTVDHVLKIANHIGIPLIWSVTDSTAAEFVKNYANAQIVKVHNDSTDLVEISKFCRSHFEFVIHNYKMLEYMSLWYTKKERTKYNVYYTTDSFPPTIDQLQYNNLDKLKSQLVDIDIGYESREESMFPNVTLYYRNIDFIEKYLGDDDSNNSCVLTPQQLYEYHKNFELLETANGKE
jgi:sialic acid synthase SpsE